MSDGRLSPLYWRGLFNRVGAVGVIQELDTLLPVHQEEVAAAMQFASEDKQKAIAVHIDRSWRGFVPMDKLSNGADWVNREILHFLRGDKEEFWLDLLLSNYGHAQRHPFSIVFQEAENALRAGPDFPINRIERFFGIAVSHGIRTEDRSDTDYPSALQSALAVVPLLHDKPEELKTRWRGLLAQIEDKDKRLVQIDAWEGNLLRALSSADVSTVGIAARNFVGILEKDRRISPFSTVINRAEAQDDYPLIECLEALTSAGLDIEKREPCGSAPLFSLLSATDLSSNRLHEALTLMLSRGARIDTLQSTSVFNPATDMTHCLHMAVYLPNLPLDMIEAKVSSWDPVDTMGMTPLLYACRDLKTDIAHALLDRGANAIACTPALNTALHEIFEHAVMDFLDTPSDPVEIARLALRLCEMGVDPAALNDQGEEALVHMCKGVSSAERAEKCLCLLKEIDALGWSMPEQAMLETLPRINSVSRVQDFLLAKKAARQHGMLDQDTMSALPRVGRRPGL